MRRRVMIAAVLLGLAACSGENGAPQSDVPGMTVTASTVASRVVPAVLPADGSIAPWHDVIVSAEASVAGLAIADIAVEAGDAVKKGDVLARLNDATLRAQLKQAEASLAAARATRSQAAAEAARARDLVRRGVISRQAADAKIAAAGNAEAQVALAEAARTEAQTRLDLTVIAAPTDGYVAARSATLGQTVQAGGELFRIVRDGKLEFVAEIADGDLARLRPGQTVRVWGERVAPVEGQIRLVSPAVDPRTRLGMAYVALPQGTGLRPGMFARGEIALDAAPSLFVPQASVVFREGRAGCFVVGGDSVVAFQPVETGRRAGDVVEIVAGLAEGQRVVVAGAGFLATGDRVAIEAEDTPPAALPHTARLP